MMDAKTIAMMQQAAGEAAARRSGKTGTGLLSDNDNNIGNAAILQPTLFPLGSLQGYTTNPSTERIRLLNLQASSSKGQSMTIVMTAARVSSPSGFAGPITGIIEFGNGSVSTSIEFDIPIGPYSGSAGQVDQSSQPQDSGAVIQVPTGIVRAYARYDNALVQPILYPTGPAFGQPTLNTNPPSPSPFAINPVSGPFSPNPTNNDPAGPYGNPLVPASPANPNPYRAIAPVQVKAFANYFGRHHTKLYKTQYLYVGDSNVPVLFGVPSPALQIPPAYDYPLHYAIPPFAKSVRVVRYPQTSVMRLALWDQMSDPNNAVAPPFPNTYPVTPAQFWESYTIPAGPCAPIPIDGQSTVVMIRSNTGNDPVSAVKLIYEIGF